MDMDNSSMSSGFSVSGNVEGIAGMGNYNSGGVMSSLLSGLTQLLFVVLILSIIVGLAVWLKNKYFKESFDKGKQFISNDPMLKTIFVLASTLVGVLIVLYLLGVLMNGGFNPNQIGLVSSLSVSGIITFFIKVLTVLFVVALIAFLYNYVKQNIKSTSIASSSGVILSSGAEEKSTQKDVTEKE
ncbi:hypothetical protein [Paenibacillus sp. FSL L8-0709]|uniref:hypothetical protein n=1 Tax=Paenibacillus sp. FSL L8-0709 TaxID=2975312 RepID=UPI0030F8E711